MQQFTGISFVPIHACNAYENSKESDSFERNADLGSSVLSVVRVE